MCPHLGWLDKEVREYVSHRAEFHKNLDDRGKKLVVSMRLHRLKWDEYKSKYYKNRIKMYVRSEERIVSFKDFKVTLVENKELLEEYEKRASKYKKQIRHQLYKLDEEERDILSYVNEILNKDSEVKLIQPSDRGERVYEGDVKRQYKIPHAY